VSFRFRNFKVYKDAQALHLEIIKLVTTWPRNEYYLSDQLRRASLSIILNIAEGSSKQSDKDFNRFITISLGSVDEVIACLEIALKLKLLSESEFKILEETLDAINKQLGGFSKSLKS